MSFEVTVVNEKNFPCVKEYTRYYSEILSSAEKVLSLDKNYVLSAIFVDDEEIHQINRDYRNIDRPTDVISFASMDDAEDFEWEMDEIELGDIFINVDAVARQAVEYGHSELREASFLFTHGVLHLLGYDHMEEEDEKEMFALQDKILDPIISRERKTTMTQEELIHEAFEAMKNAYAPYSNYHVGACILTKDGKLYYGANIENASYPAGVCGERSAIFAAYSRGVRKEDIEALAIVSDGKRIGAPCGVCRQVLSELLEQHTPIILSNGKETKVTDIAALLPDQFSTEDLQ